MKWNGSESCIFIFASVHMLMILKLLQLWLALIWLEESTFLTHFPLPTKLLRQMNPTWQSLTCNKRSQSAHEWFPFIQLRHLTVIETTLLTGGGTDTLCTSLTTNLIHYHGAWFHHIYRDNWIKNGPIVHAVPSLAVWLWSKQLQYKFVKWDVKRGEKWIPF